MPLSRLVYPAFFLAAQTASALIAWSPLDGLDIHLDKALLEVGDALWIATDSGILVTDAAGMPGKKLDSAPKNAGKVIALRREPGRILARYDGGYRPNEDYGWWETRDSGRFWSPCDSACMDPFPARKRISNYATSGDDKTSEMVETSEAFLFPFPNGILRRIKGPKSRWEIALMEKTVFPYLQMQRTAQGILILDPKTFMIADTLAQPRLALLSTDEGRTWKPVNPAQSHCMTAIESRGVLICSEEGRLSLSRDEGKTWSKVMVTPRGKTQSFAAEGIMSLAGPWVFYGGREIGEPAIFYSEDAGLTWHDRTPPKADLSSINFSASGLHVLSGGHALLGGKSLNVTRDSGKNWLEKPLPGTDSYKHFYSMASSKTRLWILTESKYPFFSTDMGDSWQAAKLPASPGNLWGEGDKLILRIAASDSSLLSLDEGATWESIPTGLPQVTWKMVWKGRWWMATHRGLHASADSGASWNLQDVRDTAATVGPFYGGDIRGDSLLMASAHGLFLTVGNSGAWQSVTKWPVAEEPYQARLGDGAALAWNGHSWLKVWDGDSLYSPVSSGIIRSIGAAFAGRQPRWITDIGLFGYRTGESAPHWFADVHGSLLPGGLLQGLADQEGTLSCLTSWGLYQSADSGRNWAAQAGPTRDYTRPGRLLNAWNGLLLSDSSGIWFRGRLQDKWMPLLSAPGGAYDTLFASDSLIVVAGAGKALLRGPQDSSWKALDSLPGKMIGLHGRRLFADAGPLFHISDDMGKSWRETRVANCGNGGIANRTLSVLNLGDTLAVFQISPLCGTSSPAQVHITRDGGLTWTLGGTGTAFAPRAGIFSAMQSKEFAWWSADKNWLFRQGAGEVTDLTGKPISLAYSRGRLYAAYRNKIFWTDAFGNEGLNGVADAAKDRRNGLSSLSLRRGAGGSLRAHFTAYETMTVVIAGFDTRGRALFKSPPLRVAAGPVEWPLPKVGTGPCLVRLLALP